MMNLAYHISKRGALSVLVFSVLVVIINLMIDYSHLPHSSQSKNRSLAVDIVIIISIMVVALGAVSIATADAAMLDSLVGVVPLIATVLCMVFIAIFINVAFAARKTHARQVAALTRFAESNGWALHLIINKDRHLLPSGIPNKKVYKTVPRLGVDTTVYIEGAVQTKPLRLLYTSTFISLILPLRYCTYFGVQDKLGNWQYAEYEGYVLEGEKLRAIIETTFQ